MRQKPNGCSGCPLERLGTGFARTDGKGRLGVLAVAEALGEDEARAGTPLVGRAGRTFNRIVARTYCPDLKRNLERDDFLLGNIVNCRPPDNILVGAPYEVDAVANCRPYLLDTIRRFQPKAIVTLGNSPLRWFTGHWGIEKLRGYVFDTEFGPVVPTYHPSYIQRGKWQLARVMETDLLKAVRVAREGRHCFDHDKVYITNPSVEEAYRFYEQWNAAGRPPVAFDIETPHGSDKKDEEMTFEEDDSYLILMCSIAWRSYEAMSMPWVPPFTDVIKAFLGNARRSLVWNAKFDVPRLAANGVQFGGEVVDAMIMWHWLEPSLPMGLKFVATWFCPDMDAWALKKDEDFAYYNCGDSDVLLRSYYEIQNRLVIQDRWKIFQRHFLDLSHLLQKMTNRGICIDREVRNAHRKEFEADLEKTKAEAVRLAPPEVRPVHPKKGYKKSEEQLKTGKKPVWVEGRMRKIQVEVSEKELSKDERDRAQASLL